MISPEPASSPETPKRPRSRRVKQAFLWATGIVALAVGVVAAVLLFALERQIVAPDWLRDRVAARIEQVFPDATIDLGGLTFELRPSFDVAVGIDNLALSMGGGDRLFDLARLDVTLSRRGLARAQMEAKSITAAGLFLTLERGADGQFDLGFGDSVAQSAPDIMALLSDIDLAMENPQLAALRSVSLEAVTLEYRDLLSQRSWLVDGGRIEAQRTGDDILLRGDVAVLGGGADVATLELSASSPIGSRAWSMGMILDGMPAADIASQSPALSWLGVLRAPISGALRTDIDATGQLGLLNATLQIGAGVLQPSEATRPIAFESARTYFTFDPKAARFDFNELSVTSDWVTATGTGTALLRLGDSADDLDVTGLTGRLDLERLSGNPAEIFAGGPRSLSQVRADFQLGLAPFRFRVGQITALGGEAGDLHLLGQADVRTDADGWSVSALIQAPMATADQLLTYWPDGQVRATRRWLANNVLSGAFANIQSRLRLAQGQRPEIYLGAEVADVSLNALNGLPPLSIAAGRLTLEDRVFTIVADEAEVDPGQGGLIDATGTLFRIPNTGNKRGTANVRVRTEGSIEATLALLDHPPFRILSAAGRQADLAEGRAEVQTDITFPLIPEDRAAGLSYRARGTLRDVRSDKIVPGRAFAADALSVDVAGGAVPAPAVEISGPGTLSGVPFEATWRLPLSGPRDTLQSELAADITLNDASLRAFGVALPPGSVSGQTTATLRISLPRGTPPSFSLSSDLNGLGLAIPAVNWRLSEATEGRFAVAGALGPVPRIDAISLQAPGLEARGRLLLSEAARLEQLELDEMRVGDWLSGALTLIPQGPGQPPALDLRDGQIDLRGLPQRSSNGSATAGQSASARTPLALSNVTLTVGEQLRLTNLTGDVTLGSGVSGSFNARVNGGAPIRGEARRFDGRTGVDLRAEDAGAVLRDAGIFPDMTGGRFALKLRPAPQPGSFDGDLSIDQLRIRNLPAFAALLDAVSIVGLLDELGGQGVYFEEIDARFRLSSERITIAESSAVGPSMGLSLDGIYDLSDRTLSFQGVLSPLYAVNILGRVFARRGEGLIGINFNMDGPARAPSVTINPFSALTPGMFREIFRRPAPSLDE